jgi:hypothetical protein
MSSFENIKEHLNDYQSKPVFHKATNFTLTAQSMSREGYKELYKITSPNPFKEGFHILNKIEEEIEINIILFAYGIKEFKENKDLSKAYIDKKDFGESNEKVLKEIKELNPPPSEKIEDIILILAFSHKELTLIQSTLEAGAKKELAIYVSDINNTIEALDYCSDLFKAYNIILNISNTNQVSIEHASLLLAKALFIKRGFALPQQLEKVEFPGEKKVAPNINVIQE